MNRIVFSVLWLVAVLSLVWALSAPDAGASGCDARYDACAAPRWCPSTGTLIPPFSGYCPVGPHIYSPPFGDDDGSDD